MKKMEKKEKIKERIKILLQLFLIFLKVGLFSFGGGYTMVVFYEREFVEKKKWLTAEEFSDLLAISESTPGPIAINGATYIGYRIGGFSGALISTIATCIPSFVIIYVISLFFDAFLEIKLVQYAFKGIQAGVSLLILIAGIKMFKKMKKNVFNVAVFSVGAVCMITFAVLAIKFSSIYYIIAGAFTGLCCYFIGLIKNKRTAEATGMEKKSGLIVNENSSDNTLINEREINTRNEEKEINTRNEEKETDKDNAENGSEQKSERIRKEDEIKLGYGAEETVYKEERKDGGNK